MSLLPIVSETKEGSSCASTSLNPVSSSAPAPAILAEEGFSGNVLLVTLGCAKNLVDSEVMLGALKSRGFRPVVKADDADLIVVNTCAFLQSAVEEGIDRILELAKYKVSGRCRRLIVAGCMVERYRSDLEQSFPEVDRFISTDELLSVADEEQQTSKDCFAEARRPYFIYDENMPRVRSTAGYTAYVKIAEGCDRPCSFCIIPKIRGKFRSRSVQSLAIEVRDLYLDGVKEVNLVAQDLTSYGVDLPKELGAQNATTKKAGAPRLVELLNEFTAIPSAEAENINFWVRLLYAYPIGVDEELVRLIVDSPVICNYLDMPLQHVSNSVLKRMNRPLGERGTRSLIEQIRKIAPEIALRTTFIVGFPGETEEDVDRLESFIREGHFCHVGIFTYSQEAEAKSFTFSDQLEDEVKEHRRARLMAAQQEMLAKRFAKLVGATAKVLIEGSHEDSDLLLTARTEWQAPETDGLVIINEIEDSILPSGELPTDRFCGKFGLVEFTEVAGYDLVARLVSV